MTAPRLASSVLVGALVRKAEAEGGFAAVLAKGDATSGSILLILTERGANPRIFERVLQTDGEYRWEATVLSVSDDGQVPSFIARRRRFDSDSWALELDVPSIERFAAEMNSFG